MSIKVNVYKAELLSKLRQNRKIHKQEVEELREAFLDALEQKIMSLLVQVRESDLNTSLRIDLTKPESYTSSYDEVIGMLEMSIDEEFAITQEDYKKYVMNEWSWTNNFEFTKSSYSR